MKEQILKILLKYAERTKEANAATEEIIDLLKSYKNQESINDVIAICDFNEEKDADGLIKESFLVVDKQDLE